jgi:hypothetical protein
MRACTHAGPRAFGRTTRACSMRVASASAARCTACGCIGRTQVFRREKAEHFGRCKHLPLPCARHLTRCYGLQPAALRTAGSMLMQCGRCCLFDCPPTFAAVQAHRSTVSQPVPIPSGVHGCGNRTDSRYRPRRRRVHSGRAVGRRLPGEPVVWSSAGQRIGACSSPRSGRTLRQGKADAAGLRIFTHRSGAADVADRPTKPPLMRRGVQ